MRKLGCNTGAYKGNKPEENLKIIKDVGFEAFFTGFSSEARTAEMINTATELGIVCDNLHAPFKYINNIWAEGEAGEAMLGQLLDCSDACAHCGIPAMVVHLSSKENAPCVNDIGHARFDRLIERAVKNNVTVAFENQRKLANISFVMELYRDIPQVGFCWDTGHEYCFTKGREYMTLFGDRLAALHIHDNEAVYNGDYHMIPFDGRINFGRVAEHIRNSGYAGTLMLEILPQNSSYYTELSAEEYYAKAYEAAKKLRVMTDGEN